MKTKRHFDADEVLNALQGMQRAQAPPFLYTRVMAKIEAQTQAEPWQQVLNWLARPAIAFSLVFVFLLAEAWALWQNTPAAGTQASAYEQLPEEWSTLKASTLYDYENPAP
ncbi:MAG: hypothetical protein ACK4E8_12855 [Lacibacter sp.]